MIGHPSERALVGYALAKPNRRLALTALEGHHFSDPTLGAIWDGIANDLHAGKAIDAYSVDTRFPDWGVSGPEIRVEIFHMLTEGQELYFPEQAVESIRQAADRRHALELIDFAKREIMTGSTAGDVMHRVVREVHERDQGAVRADTFRSYSVAELLDMDHSDDFVIDGIIERYDRLVLTGVEGHGKSTMARQIMLYSAAGLHPFRSYMGKALPLENGPVRSLVIDAENTKKQWSRNLGWMVRKVSEQGSRWTPHENMHVVPTGRLNVLRPADLGLIHKLIDEKEPDVVFIGPLYRITPGGLNNEEEAALGIAALDTIRDRGVALIVEAHSGHAKDGNVRSVRPRGSSAIMGWPEFGMGIRPLLEPMSGQPVPGEYELSAWRGAREADRAWPDLLRRGDMRHDPFPWMPNDEPLDNPWGLGAPEIDPDSPGSPWGH